MFAELNGEMKPCSLYHATHADLVNALLGEALRKLPGGSNLVTKQIGDMKLWACALRDKQARWCNSPDEAIQTALKEAGIE